MFFRCMVLLHVVFLIKKESLEKYANDLITIVRKSANSLVLVYISEILHLFASLVCENLLVT
jgi:hypothetical protein